MPEISVIICAYNAERDVGNAISSILAQTFQDVEIIVVNDGSTDRTAAMVGEMAAKNIRLINHPRNLGTACSRNTGVQSACGKYVAFLDADDIAYPRRLETQKRFLDQHRDIYFCGSWADFIFGDKIRQIQFPVSAEAIRKSALLICPFLTSAIMGRAEVFKENPFAVVFKKTGEDYDFFLQINRRYALANIPESLVAYKYSGSLWYRLRDQYWKTFVRFRAMTKHGYPLTQAYCLFMPMLMMLVPPSVKNSIRHRYLEARQTPRIREDNT
ncbi:glycosyltransferase family 2 protein [candidate division FCPU426 bacterium]|nr:glycosyltransferase family 2 protein [candidate division FCPU426 bacterium]